MRRPLTLLALLFTALPLAAAAQSPELPPKEQFHLFLLLGQSNMAGRGKVEDEDRRPDPRVLMFDRQNHWVPAVDPLHFDKPAVVGVGIGRSFALQVAEHSPGITIGLIPCAVGGSPIDTWVPGGYHEQTKSHPWDDMLRRAKLALPAGTLKGILWHQGESDANATDAPKYRERLHELVARCRREFDSPEVPFLAGQMGQFSERPWDDFKREVDQVHRDLPRDIARSAFVSSEGLSHNGDAVHFDAKSYRMLGKRYAEAYLKLTR